jgi:hypothetical protein
VHRDSSANPPTAERRIGDPRRAAHSASAFTVEDPEFACHEGNYSLRFMLEAARTLERDQRTR